MRIFSILAIACALLSCSSNLPTVVTVGKASPAVDDYHLADVAILIPNDDPESMPSLSDVDVLRDVHQKVIDQLYGREALAESVRTEFLNIPQVAELEPLSCLENPDVWKLVAVRLDPFGTLAPGDALSLDARAEDDPRYAHRRVPQVRLSYQPFCHLGRQEVSSVDRRRAADAALHVLLTAYQDPADAALHRSRFQAMRAKIANRAGGPMSPEAEQSLRSAEAEYLSFVSDTRRDRDIDAVASLIREMRRLRQLDGASTAEMDTQLAAIASEDGVIRQDANGEPALDVTHPLMSDRQSPAMQALVSAIDRYSSAAHIHQIRMMSAGKGELFWAFSASEFDAETGEFGAVPMAVTHTGGHGLPETILDLGIYDVLPVAHTAEYQALSASDRALVDQYVMTFNPQEPVANARRAVIFESRLNDPERSGHATRTCYGCHESQERMSMALRAVDGAAPREWGYFFRAFGYVSSLPFISRRLVQEANATVRGMRQWDRQHERGAS